MESPLAAALLSAGTCVAEGTEDSAAAASASCCGFKSGVPQHFGFPFTAAGCPMPGG